MFLKAKERLANSRDIVFFGGAGVSTASGIPDFRSATGLYNRASGTAYSPEYMLSHEFFILHTKAFYDYLRGNLLYPDAKPNRAHLALAALEKQGRLRALITQNIDGLHQRAGSEKVIEIHGNLTDYYCMSCGQRYDAAAALDMPGVPRCRHCGGTVRPDVVLYGEALREENINRALRAVRQCDVLIVGGTSLAVWPAAGFVGEYEGNALMFINREPTPYDSRADYLLRGDIDDVLWRLVME